MTKTNEFLDTTDLYIPSVVKYMDPKLQITFTRGRDDMLIFRVPLTPEVTDILNSYHRGELLVIARDFAKCIKKVRALLFEQKNNGGAR